MTSGGRQSGVQKFMRRSTHIKFFQLLIILRFM
jgi:hypothetical protein